VITRPIAAGKWKDNDKQTFREQLEARHTGNNAVSTLILDEGMTFAARAFSPRESEFVAARKLTDEEVARAYHVPLPMVGILDHATFSNIKEQHKQLYQDCLGPWLQMISEELERQLLSEASDLDRVYLEFNIQEKLKGSFEEQAASLYTLVGRPIMTANEGRARLNLPRITDDDSADALALPLNTAAGPSAPPPMVPDGAPVGASSLPDRRGAPLQIEARVEAIEKYIDGELALDETEAA